MQELAPDTLIHNRYLIVHLIGKGGMGAVYKAIDQRLGNMVALKQTLTASERMNTAFEREARLLASLRHPALPKVIDFFFEGAGHFLVMEFFHGKNLEELLWDRRNTPFPLETVLEWADQLLDALDYLHGQIPPVIHRDIKLQNIKLTPENQIVLLDFGLAKGTSSSPSHHAHTTVSIFGYTPQYAPLEQIQGTGTDQRSDLYSLAATLYHLLTGSPPENALKRTSAIMNEQPDPLQLAHELNPVIPPAISAVLQQALSLQIGKRYEHGAAMRAALDSVHPAVSHVPAPRTGVSLAPPPNPSYRVAIQPNPSEQPQSPSSPVAPTVALASGERPGLAPTTVISAEQAGRVEELARLGKGTIGQVAWAPSGRTLAVASSLGVYLYDAETLAEHQVIETTAAVTCVAFSPDGRTLATGHHDRQVRVWQDGTLLHTLAGHTWNVTGVAFSSDGLMLASASDDKTVRVWHGTEGTLLHILEEHANWVKSVAFAPDGSLLASGSDDNRVYLWRVADGVLLHTLEGHTRNVTSVAFSPDGSRLVSGGRDGIAQVWQVPDGALLHTLLTQPVCQIGRAHV
jgi:eukaryotic-like serine/threonine-protein kinase